MDLTDEDVTDILALLDSLPYDELDLQTPRFRLVLRRTPDGWTQCAETRSAPDALTPPAEGVALPGEATTSLPQRCAPDDMVAATTRLRDGGTASDAEVDELGGDKGADGAAWEGEGAAWEGEGADGGLVAVRAPLPGTFYRAPRPGAAPFVEVGSRVGAEDVVGIVETMKLMNSVIAGVDGTVAEICVGNAEFAANGAALLRIRAD